MRKIIVLLLLSFGLFTQAQEVKSLPQITVSGEGKIKVAPDYAIISFGVETQGKEASEVKKTNDATVDLVLRYLKKFGIAANDMQTRGVHLGRMYTGEKNKFHYQAIQNMQVTLRDLKQYDALVMGLVDQGINAISGVEFKATKLEEYKTQVRKLATQDALKRAQDYTSPLQQKVGKAHQISETGSILFPTVQRAEGFFAKEAHAMPQETLAIGEIEITAQVTISFVLE
ncbi:SIMPL domain-containing protein [Flavobacterium sp.]|jgi:uncharacterized protein YggE|uniref:SIMPL domain-containing protein n=1 Tax=Flavobacterium sp. TaxID=239 RepID=UPI0033427F88